MGIILVYCMLFCAIHTAPFRLHYNMNNSSKQDTHNSDLLLRHGAKKRENEKSHSHNSLCYSVCIPITTAVGDADAAAQINTTRYLELPKIKGGGIEKLRCCATFSLFFESASLRTTEKYNSPFFRFFHKKKSVMQTRNTRRNTRNTQKSQIVTTIIR